jgi:hypothetical protein
LIGLVVAVTGAGTAAAQGTLARIKDTGTITLGNGDSSIPFVYYDGDHGSRSRPTPVNSATQPGREFEDAGRRRPAASFSTCR